MEDSGYTFERDPDFSFGEQYWVYKGNTKVGWVRMSSGLLRVATEYPPKDLLLCEPFGDTPEGKFRTSKEYRQAIRKATSVLKEHYGDKTPLLKQVLAIMGPVKPVELEQTNLFGA